MSDHDWVVIGFFLMSVWWLLLIKFHPDSKNACLYYALGSFLLGLLGLFLNAYTGLGIA